MYERFHLDVKGTGLGLYLVKSQIENLGGTIQVQSQPVEGTAFTVTLPIPENPSSKPTKRLQQDLLYQSLN